MSSSLPQRATEKQNSDGLPQGFAVVFRVVVDVSGGSVVVAVVTGSRPMEHWDGQPRKGPAAHSWQPLPSSQ